MLAENTSICRGEEGVHLHLDMLTPEAGSHTYPENVRPKQRRRPEVFAGWAFVFNYPELCEVPFDCGPGDFNETVRAGIYNFAGATNQISHTGGSETLLNAATDGFVRIAGDIATGQAQRPNSPPGATTFALENPMGAEIHAAIAPHGAYNAKTIAQELFNPAGNPGCGCWWVAVFESPDAPADTASD